MESVEGVKRFLSRRDNKDGASHRRQKSRDKSSDKKTRPKSVDNLFNLFKGDATKKETKEQKEKVEQVKKLLKRSNYSDVDELQVSYALQSKFANGDMDKAARLLLLFQESVEGQIKPYDPTVQMVGAVNREGVTCYLDSVLFSMFAKMDNFEPVLYKNFEDDARRNLSMLIRLWVNMLRTGSLVDVDITKHLQDALAVCGWEPDGMNEQQDASEFFMFLTEKLHLPLLELKQDIYYDVYGAAKDSKDDHRVIQERLLDVAVPEEVSGRIIRLEDCLETYFNNTVEVQRAPNRSLSVQSNLSSEEKAEATHVESKELSSSNPGTPLSIHPPATPLSRLGMRHRTDSLITTRITEKEVEDLEGREAEQSSPGEMTTKPLRRKASKEVGIPAYQFFNLMPWYTKSTGVGVDGEIAEYFKRAVPTMCIRLKRYGMNDKGEPIRINTLIDIPVDIRLPHFVDEENIIQGGPLMGNFKLSLQSVICHRGHSTCEGHYVSFIRGITETAVGDFTSDKRLSSTSLPPNYPTDQWIKHDDLGYHRVENVDIEQALKDEMPYLLFYQVQPLLQGPSLDTYNIDPPAYAQNPGIDVQISESSPLAQDDQEEGYFKSSRQPVVANGTPLCEPESRRSLNLPESRRGSVAPDSSPERSTNIVMPESHPEESSVGSTASSIFTHDVVSAPSTPIEEINSQRLSRAAWAFRSGSRSRPTSSSGGDRISATFSRLVRNGEKQPAKDAVQSALSLQAPLPGDLVVDTKSVEPDSLPKDQVTPKQTRLRSKDPKKRLSANGVFSSHGHSGKLQKELPDRQCSVM
ncbi:ubiquitin carboxyl-terminal hydrolase-domain-containing protein [Calycina marina]|uniref:ubiquitinyl hydrolase 1 n=1 Tax=Calycina marina TaxID=1763456 RepID=A0A9P7ZD27_9HELO|nr:ubiquitin carboxyl-terminal hydrolase-domain-containing protein [Calycina marina]